MRITPQLSLLIFGAAALGACPALNAPDECTAHEECEASAACLIGRCVPVECRDRAQCGPGQECHNFTCTEPAGCEDDGDCGGGAICVELRCVCASHHGAGCLDGDLWWFDSCGAAEELRTTCLEGCVADQCSDCTPLTCEQQDRVCGVWDDGCGRERSCGQCGANERCDDDGKCVVSCPNGRELCGDTCVDTATDARHCGRCDRACPPEQACVSARCEAVDDCRDVPCPGGYYCDLATGGCLPGCLIDQECETNEVCDSANHSCECGPGFHRFSSGRCGSGCEIQGVERSHQAVNSSNPCEICDTARAIEAWSVRSDGTSCGGENYCNRGHCTACLEGRSCTPANPCHRGVERCDGSGGSCVDQGTSVDDGSSCGSASVCVQGDCRGGCYVDGSFYEPGERNPSGCLSCQPSQARQALVPLDDGTACGDGQVCVAESCIEGCFIDGAFQAPDTEPAANPCASCQPPVSTTTWSDKAEGASCGTNDICVQGDCVAGCYVDGVYYAEEEPSPDDPCYSCNSWESTTSFSASTGAPCGDGSVCDEGTCRRGCYWSGMVISEGSTVNHGCGVCRPDQSIYISDSGLGTCWYPSGCCGYCSSGSCNFVGCDSYCP